MWRNPVTHRFEAGNPPYDRRSPASPNYPDVPQTPQAQQPARGGDIHGGWEFVPTAGGTPDAQGSVEDIRDVLGVSSYAIKGAGTQSDTLPLDQTHTDDPHPFKDGGPAPVPKG